MRRRNRNDIDAVPVYEMLQNFKLLLIKKKLDVVAHAFNPST